MEFETMDWQTDWEAEVRRMKAAFGLEGEYRFVGNNQPYEEVTPEIF